MTTWPLCDNCLSVGHQAQCKTMRSTIAQQHHLCVVSPLHYFVLTFCTGLLGWTVLFETNSDFVARVLPSSVLTTPANKH